MECSLRKKLPVLTEDIVSLHPQSFVNGMVINAYFRLIERRSIFYKSLPRVWAFDTTFWQDWTKGGYERVRYRTRGVDLLAKDLLLVPLHLPSVGTHGHWALVAVKPKRAQLLAFDSLHLKRENEMSGVLDFLQQFSLSRGTPIRTDLWQTQETPTRCPKQSDATSCGVYVCAFADLIARRIDPASRSIRTKEVRVKIAQILRRGKFGEEEFPWSEIIEWQMENMQLERIAAPFDYETIDLTSAAQSDEESTEENGQVPRMIDETDAGPVDQPIRPMETMDSSPCLLLCDEGLEAELADSGADTKLEDCSRDGRQIGPELSSEQLLEVPGDHPDGQSAVESELSSQQGSWIPTEIREKSRHQPYPTQKQRRNQRLRVRRPDGTFFRIRPSKLKRLAHLY